MRLIGAKRDTMSLGCALGALLIAVLLPVASSADTPQSAVHFKRGSAVYIVASPGSPLETRVLERLSDYAANVTGRAAVAVASLKSVPSDRPAIVLVNGRVRSPIALGKPGSHPESFLLATGNVGKRPVVVAAGKTDLGLKRAVQRMIIVSRQEPGVLVIPPLRLSESPWIRSREWTVCPWVPDNVRGMFYNPYADKRMNIYLYGDKRLADYVEMFDWFGYSGAQLMETSYNYKVFGSVEDAHAFQKRLARSLRDHGQQVSVWTWSAEFNFGGWVDPDNVYDPAPGKTAWEDPRVHRTFERYYDIYADLAPYADRFVCHFFDPGRLTSHSDVFKYAKLLESKVKARNPKVEMAIDSWAQKPDYLVELADNGLGDYLLLPVAFPELYSGDAREKLHDQARKLGLRLGIWGWYTTEYETDQLASMYVNARLLKGFYNEIRNGAYKHQPVEYWSEMEATRLVNIFSMYAAARLLWNPDLDPHDILVELTEGVWGPRNGPEVLRAVELIADVRTGPTWETYWWTRAGHRVGTADTSEDLRRASRSIAELSAMKTDKAFVPKFPLPYPPEVFIELMLPHLRQIKLFAEFRIATDAIRAAAKAGTDTATLERMLTDAWQPVPEFNTWVGTFGSKELRQQKIIVAELRRDYGLTAKDPEWLRLLEATKAVQMFRNRQSGSAEPIAFGPADCGEFFWPEPDRKDRLEKAVEVGLMTRLDGDRYQLSDWQNWKP